MNAYERYRSDLEIENEYLRAVTDAAVVYIHNVEAGHHGPNQERTKRALVNLHEEVSAYLEWEQDSAVDELNETLKDIARGLW